MNQEDHEHKSWKQEYTIVLVLNFIYVLVFAYIMASYT